MSDLALGVTVIPHLIPAATLPNRDIDRAMQEPLALGRDEVIYMICTHPRVRAVWPKPEDRELDVLIARHAGASDIGWDPQPWARVTVPDHVRRSNVEWSLIDPALETVEGLVPTGFDPGKDPDGEVGAHRQELLGWIFDRHLDAVEPPNKVDRGSVEGGEMSFQLEYIGMSGSEALLRAAGAHHKLPLILNRTLVYTPHRLVYVLPCELRIAAYDPDAAAQVKLLPFGDALIEYDLPREVIIPAAEEMLISRLGAPENERSTGKRRFPNSAPARRLSGLGYSQVGIDLEGIPPNVCIAGKHETIGHDSDPVGWKFGKDN